MVRIMVSIMALGLLTQNLFADSSLNVVRQYTRNSELQIYFNQGLLATADFATAYTGYRLFQAFRMIDPADLQTAKEKQKLLQFQEAQKREVLEILEKMKSGEIDLKTPYPRFNLWTDSETAIYDLEQSEAEHIKVQRATSESLKEGWVPKDDRVVVRQRTENFLSKQNLLVARADAFKAIKQAKDLAQIESTLSGLAREIDGMANATRGEVNALWKSIANRIHMVTGLRVVTTVLGLAAIADFGTRAYIIFIEDVDPGLFPVLKIARGADVLIKQGAMALSEQLNATVSEAQKFGSELLNRLSYVSPAR